MEVFYYLHPYFEILAASYIALLVAPKFAYDFIEAKIDKITFDSEKKNKIFELIEVQEKQFKETSGLYDTCISKVPPSEERKKQVQKSFNEYVNSYEKIKKIGERINLSSPITNSIDLAKKLNEKYYELLLFSALYCFTFLIIIVCKIFHNDEVQIHSLSTISWFNFFSASVIIYIIKKEVILDNNEISSKNKGIEYSNKTIYFLAQIVFVWVSQKHKIKLKQAPQSLTRIIKFYFFLLIIILGCLSYIFHKYNISLGFSFSIEDSLWLTTIASMLISLLPLIVYCNELGYLLDNVYDVLFINDFDVIYHKAGLDDLGVRQALY